MDLLIENSSVFGGVFNDKKSRQDVFLDRNNHAKAFGGRKFFILQDRTKHEHDRIF